MQRISSIPEPYLEGYEKIATYEDDFFEQLYEGLGLTSLTSTVSALAKKVSELKQLDVDDVREIFMSVGSLSTFLSEEITTEVLSKDLSDVLVKRDLEGKKSKEIISSRIKTLLDNQQIFYASKASILLTENENVYLRAKMVTDIRPIFSTNIEASVIAGVVIHHLHIHYQSKEEGPHNDIYISLDTNDVKALKEQLIKAEKKEKSLSSVFNKSGMTNLDE